MSPGPVAQRPVRSIRARGGAILLLALGCLASRQTAQGAVAVAVQLPPAASQTVDFIKDIQPILAQSCYECHGPEKQKADLRWDTKASVFKVGEHGPIIIPGKSAESRVIKLVGGLDPDSVMPPKGDPLTAGQIGLLRAWIDQGANWPESAVAQAGGKTNHWAFKAPVRPLVPAVKPKKWPRNPIDDFVLARLQKEGLKPSPEADRPTLIVRILGLSEIVVVVDCLVACSLQIWEIGRAHV